MKRSACCKAPSICSGRRGVVSSGLVVPAKDLLIGVQHEATNLAKVRDIPSDPSMRQSN